eukprot:TRINITY_DN4648_c2_g1_i1.p1 TRINITY_DN4648_c2_g1~~TRINITY_DN4648_c2_g1_i1.p1  ORF type:complete len:500 (+),score=140.62 TRINITY_DN4648_c2_g1_i1:32-1501(+)
MTLPPTPSCGAEWLHAAQCMLSAAEADSRLQLSVQWWRGCAEVAEFRARPVLTQAAARARPARRSRRASCAAPPGSLLAFDGTVLPPSSHRLLRTPGVPASLPELPQSMLLRSVRGRGRAVFASRKLSKGEVVWTEAPFLVLPRPQAGGPPLRAKEVLKGIVERGHSERLRFLDSGGLQELTAEGLSRILRTNSFVSGDSKDAVLFSHASLMAHSCSPTVSYGHARTSSQEASFVAARDIAAGEELTLDYIGPLVGWGLNRRAVALLEQKRFVCNCILCQKSDVSRAVRCSCGSESAPRRGSQPPSWVCGTCSSRGSTSLAGIEEVCCSLAESLADSPQSTPSDAAACMRLCEDSLAAEHWATAFSASVLLSAVAGGTPLAGAGAARRCVSVLAEFLVGWVRSRAEVCPDRDWSALCRAPLADAAVVLERFGEVRMAAEACRCASGVQSQAKRRPDLGALVREAAGTCGELVEEKLRSLRRQARAAVLR